MIVIQQPFITASQKKLGNNGILIYTNHNIFCGGIYNILL